MVPDAQKLHASDSLSSCHTAIESAVLAFLRFTHALATAALTFDPETVPVICGHLFDSRLEGGVSPARALISYLCYPADPYLGLRAHGLACLRALSLLAANSRGPTVTLASAISQPHVRAPLPCALLGRTTKPKSMLDWFISCCCWLRIRAGRLLRSRLPFPSPVCVPFLNTCFLNHVLALLSLQELISEWFRFQLSLLAANSRGPTVTLASAIPQPHVRTPQPCALLEERICIGVVAS